MSARHRAWGEDRVQYFNSQGRLRSMLSSWTDAEAPDAFAQASSGRSWFRPDDLLRLRALLDTLRGDGDVK